MIFELLATVAAGPETSIFPLKPADTLSDGCSQPDCFQALLVLAQVSNSKTPKKSGRLLMEIHFVKSLMRKAKQETREGKICRWIRNLNRGLAQYPDLRSLQKRRAELEAQLLAMPLEERCALVPPEERERERKELIVAYTEIIADMEKELAAKRQAVQKAEGDIAEFRTCRAEIEKQ